MNASQFMDKQIMDLSRSKTTSDTINNLVHDDDHEVSETTERDAVAVDGGGGGGGGGGGVGKMDEIFPSYDFQPIRPVVGVPTQFDAVGVGSGGNRGRGSMESAQAQTAGLRGYGYLESLVPDKVIHEKAQAIDHSTLVSEIDQTLKKHADNLIHSLDGLGTRVSQLENKMSQLEHKLDDLKITVGNGHGRTDGKLWHLENILREVQSGVQNLKDKQEVMDAQMLLAKLQVSKADQTPASNTQHIDPIQQATSASQQLNQQFPVVLEPSLPTLPPPNAPLPPQHIIHPPVPMPAQFAQGQTPTLPQRDQYSPHPSQTTEKRQQFQFPPSQYQQPPTEHQPIAQPPPPLPYNQHPSTAPVNVPPRPQAPSLAYQPEETSYITPQIYPPNLQQSQPIVGPTKQFYGAPPLHANEPNMGRSSSGFQSGYIPQGPTEQYPYSGSPSRYDGSSSIKPSSLSSVMGNPNYQIPTAKLLPQSIPTASTVSSGSGSGGTGNRVPIDDVIDKVTSMGFPRDHVRATVKKLTENGQSVDLNVVLDKLMNDGGMQPQHGWFGR